MHGGKTTTRNRLAGLVGSAAFAGAFWVYFCVTFVPPGEWMRVPISMGLLLTWVGSVPLASSDSPERLRRIGRVTMLVTMPTIYVVLGLHRMLWSDPPW